jgi:N-acetylglucosaminyl-diphospho-decaprenol L-rhamnosyltransferase
VLFASYAGVWGGAERMLLNTIVGLEQPAVLACPEGPLAERARAAGVPVLSRPVRSLEARGGARVRVDAARELAAHAAELRRLVGALRPRAVVAWNMRSAIACAAGLRGLTDRPPVIFQHSDFLPAGAAAHAVRLAARAADRVIANSAAVADELTSAGLRERVAVVAPGVDLDAYTPTPLPQGDPSVLVLGAMVPWKRHDLALEAVALASRDLPGLRLVVAGHSVGRESEELLGWLRERAGQPDLAGRVELPGSLGDPREALTACWCLLHCADREPFGLVLLEAMASGRAVVAPAAGGPREIVQEGAGILFPAGDAAAAARALVELLGERERAGRAGERARGRAGHYRLGTAGRAWRDAVTPVLPRVPAPPSTRGEGLTLVTVAHGSAEELTRLLRSVARHLPGAAVVVVDSGSPDASVEVARSWSGQATVIEMGENVGFGRAANAGVAVAQTPACVVMNPDVELVDGSLAALAEEATRTDRPERLLAPLVLRPDGSRQDSVHGEPVSGAAAVTALVPPAVLPAPWRRRVQPWRSDEPRPVAWAVGCCVGARTVTLARLGPFDERIFLYGEDLELGLRAGDHAVETWWWPQARVIHHAAHSAQRVFGGEAFELLARQRGAVVAERRGSRAARWDQRLQLITFVDRIALKALTGRPASRERRQLSALRRAHRADTAGPRAR